jgi:hypothetical protein
MRITQLARFLTAFALAGIAGSALAQDLRPSTTSETIVVLSDGDGGRGCRETTPEQARSLADKAWRDGAYRRAGECYLVAGEQALANEAFVKATAHSTADTSRRLASNLNDVKAQARQMKQAFQRR